MSTLMQAVSGFAVRELRERRELTDLVPEWSDLYERCPDATPFQRPEWMLAWITAFSPQNLHVIEIRHDGRLIGLVPLLIYPRDSNRVLAFAGGGVSDYLILLADQGRESDVFSAVLQHIRAIPDWNVFELTDIPRHSKLMALDVIRGYVYEHDSSSILSLPATEQELLAAFSTRQRANLRMARSRIERAGGARVAVAGAATLPEFLEDLFRLHTARWSRSGEAGVLADERTRSFHKLCAPALLASGILKLYRLRIQEHTVAVLYSLWDRETIYCYLQGFDPGYSFLSPGTSLIFEVLKEALRRGMRRFDFLRGQERYKRHWRAQSESTCRIGLTREEVAVAML